MPLWRVPPRPVRAGVVRLLTLLVLAAGTVPAMAGLAPGRAAAVPPDVLDERALAIASPSLVYLETVYTGYLRDKQSNQPLLASPVTYNRRCSGFVVNPDGHVATTRICVAPPDATVLQQALYVAGFALIAEHQLDQSQIDSWVTDHMNSTVFTGLTDNSKPDTQLFGQLNLATGAITSAPAIHGTVVKVSEPNNVAVVRLSQGNLPAVQLAPTSTLATGTQVTALGYGTTDADPRVGTYTPEATPVQITGSGKDDTATYYKLSQSLGTYVHGGMALDASGRVVGILNEDPTLPNNTNRAVYPASVVSSLLASAGVPNTLGTSDRRYRDGLDAYFGGRYAAAMSELGQVAKAVPANQTAQVYRQYAADRKSIGGDSSGLSGWLRPAVTGIGCGLLGALIVALLMTAGRNRRRAASARNWDPYAPPPPVYRAPAQEMRAPAVPPQQVPQQPVPQQPVPQQMPQPVPQQVPQPVPQQAPEQVPQQPVSPPATSEAAWPLFPSRYAHYDVDPFAPAAPEQQVPQQQVPQQPQAAQEQQPAPQLAQLSPQQPGPEQQPVAPPAPDPAASPDAPWNVVWPVPTQVPATVQVPVEQQTPPAQPSTPPAGEQPDGGAGPRSPWAVPPSQS